MADNILTDTNTENMNMTNFTVTQNWNFDSNESINSVLPQTISLDADMSDHDMIIALEDFLDGALDVSLEGAHEDGEIEMDGLFEHMIIRTKCFLMIKLFELKAQ